MREKLIELIGRVQDEGLDYSDVVCVYKTSNGRLADYLIANGVTIPVRRKDCKHWKPGDSFSGDSLEDMQRIGRCPIMRFGRRENDFCCEGERRTDDERTG